MFCKIPANRSKNVTAHRHRWLRFISAAIALGLGCSATQAAPPVITTVYPTGSFPTDEHNVQAAINLGGTVILKATNATGQPTAFNFGPPDPQINGGVNLNTDVTILGEQVGQNATTIQGGFNPILGVVPVKSTIQGITFDGPLDSPIALVRSTGANIIGNHIKNIVPLPLFFGFTEIEGIFVSGFDDPQHAITGKIKIANNVIEISGGDFVNGMQFDEVSADIEVSGNNVQFLSSDGVIQTLGILVFRSHGKADVVNNVVMMGPGSPDVFPAGIFVAGHPDARYTISRNTVTTSHPNADGMDVLGLSPDTSTQGALVQGNFVTMQSTISTSGGIVFAGGVTKSSMVGNQVAGTNGDSLQVLGFDSTLAADSNRVLGNNISQASPSDADVFLGPDSFNTLVAGQCSTYINLGVGNRILCGTPLGSALSAARVSTSRRPMIDSRVDAIQRAKLDAIRAER